MSNFDAHEHAQAPTNGSIITSSTSMNAIFNPTDIIYSGNFGPQYIDGDGWHSNSANIGQGLKVTYAFANQEPSYYQGFIYSDFTPWNAAQIGLAEYALNLIESYTNLDYVRTNSPETADMTFINVEMGKRSATSDDDLAGGGFYADKTGTNVNTAERKYGDLVIDNDFFDTELEYTPGQYAHMVMLHEIGHTLGLIDIIDIKDADGKVIQYANIPGLQNHHRGNTIMSYNDSPQSTFTDGLEYDADSNVLNENSYEPETYMIYDILTFQYLYGVNTSFAAGNNVYNVGAGSIYWDHLRAIWDAGGNDTLDARSATQSVTLSLIDGTYSSVGNVENFGIAFNAIIENAYGGNFNDVLIGNDVANLLKGNGGDDVLDGGAGNDRLYGGLGADEIHGDEGNDTIYHQGDLGTYDGGDGIDTASFSAFDKAVWVGLDHKGGGAWHKQDADLYTGTYERAAILTNIENVIGSQFLDYIQGDVNNNRIYGQDGGDYLYGLGGNDYIFGQKGDDVINGGEGNDVLWGGLGADIIYGGEGLDRATYTQSTTAITASLFDSSVNTGEAAGDVYDSIENLQGSKFSDTLTGDDYANTLYGYDGNDQLSGGAGNDLLYGQNGSDEINGGAGNDRIVHQGELGTYNGGEGIDTVYFSSFNKAVWVGLEHNGGGAWHKQDHDLYTGIYEKAADLTNVENVVGSQHVDAIYGDAQNNKLYGQAGGDYLSGKAGDDHIYGQGGEDFIYASAGNDLLYGGADADTFIFNVIEAFQGLNQVMDFDTTDGDVFSLSGFLEGFDEVTDAISDFISLTENTTDTFIDVDLDGKANGFEAEQLVRIHNTAGEWSDVDDMISQGDLVII